MNSLEPRLQVLEREVRRSRRANRILICAVVAIAAMAGARGSSPQIANPTSPKDSPSSDKRRPDADRPAGLERLRTVEADQFVLVDRSGRSRAQLAMADGGPALRMFDEEGQKRLELSHTSGVAGLRLFDSNEAPIVSLELPRRADRAQLEIKSSQTASLTKADGFSVRDAAHRDRLHLALLNGNFPVLGISQSGQSGPPSIELTANEGSRSLKLHDDDGNPLFSVSAADGGRTSLTMRDPTHERLLQISTNPKHLAGPQITFFAPANEDGTGGQLPHLQLGFDHDHKPGVRIVDRNGRSVFTAPSD